MRIKLQMIKQEKREGDGRFARGRRCAGKSHQPPPTVLRAISLLAHSRGTIRARRVLGKERGI